MISIRGKQQIPHERPYVFAEGISSHHWEYENKGFYIKPRAKTIKKAGVVAVGFNAIGIKTDFTAKVTECEKNKLVRINGEDKRFGKTQLLIELADDEELERSTLVSYGLNVDLIHMSRFARLAVEKPLDMYLRGLMDPYIKGLTNDIGGALTKWKAEEAIELRQAS